MNTESTDEMLVVTQAGRERRAERGVVQTVTAGVQGIGVGLLRKNMANFLRQLREILDQGTVRVGSFVVEQVEISAQITADGQVCLLGSGIGVKSQNVLKLVLKRAESPPSP